MSIDLPHNSFLQRKIVMAGWRRIIVGLRGVIPMVSNVFLWILMCWTPSRCVSAARHGSALLSLPAKYAHVAVVDQGFSHQYLLHRCCGKNLRGKGYKEGRQQKLWKHNLTFCTTFEGLISCHWASDVQRSGNLPTESRDRGEMMLLCVDRHDGVL